MSTSGYFTHRNVIGVPLKAELNIFTAVEGLPEPEIITFGIEIHSLRVSYTIEGLFNKLREGVTWSGIGTNCKVVIQHGYRFDPNTGQYGGYSDFTMFLTSADFIHYAEVNLIEGSGLGFILNPKIFSGKIVNISHYVDLETNRASITSWSSEGTLVTIIQIDHWLADLNAHSFLSRYSHVSNPESYYYPIIPPGQLTGFIGEPDKGYSSSAVVLTFCNPSTLTGDIWYNCLYPLFRWFSEQNFMVDPFTGQPLIAIPFNVEVLRALDSIVSPTAPLNFWFCFAFLMPFVSHSLALEVGSIMAGEHPLVGQRPIRLFDSDDEDKLLTTAALGRKTVLNLLLPVLHILELDLIPLSSIALVVPRNYYFQGSFASWRVLTPEDYSSYEQIDRLLPRPLAATLILVDMDSLTGAAAVQLSLPGITVPPGGAYVNLAALHGIIEVLTEEHVPKWLTRLVPGSLVPHMGLSPLPNEEQFGEGGARPYVNLAFNGFNCYRYILDLFARYKFMDLTYYAKEARVETYLRTDIAPGSLITIKFDNNPGSVNGVVGRVEKVELIISVGSETAFSEIIPPDVSGQFSFGGMEAKTILHLTHVRPIVDDLKHAFIENPIWSVNFIGYPII